MSLSSVSIRRPVLASVLSIAIVLLGVISFSGLGVREYPAVEFPIITVSTSYTGASAHVIEREITDPLEEQINAISGIRTLTSVSEQGSSRIRIEFNAGVDLENAANDVRDRVSRAAESLPPDANPPSVRKEDPDSNPIVFLNLNSNIRDRLELTQIARDVFRERLRTIDGISIVSVWGQQRYAMRLWLDPQLMAAYSVTPLDVRNALDRENVELPSGLIEGDHTELTIRTMGRLSDVDEFRNLIIREEGGGVIRFGDVGVVELSTRDDRTILKRDGEPMVGIVAIPQPGSNQIAAAREIHRRVDQIKRELPPDIEVTLGFDTTEHVLASISQVRNTILLAFALVVLVIFLFLRNLRTTLIPVIVVPIALTGSFFVMFSFGFSINILTLLALILAVSLVVDDAIIVLENIYAKIEQGTAPLDAGIAGTKEIFFAVVATTLSLMAVFAPITFLEGTTGSLFKEFGVVLAGTVLISSFVALTLVPMLSTRFLAGHKQSRFYIRTEPFFQKMVDSYRKALDRFMLHRKRSFWILGVCAALIPLFFWILPEEVAPLEDRSALSISAVTPEGSTFEYTDMFMDEIIDVVNEHVPEVLVLNTVTASGAVNRGSGFVTLVHPSERRRSQQEIARALGQELQRLPAGRTYVSQQQTLSSGSSGLPVQFVLQAASLEELSEAVPGFVEAAQQDPTFEFVDVDLKFNKPELLLEIDRDRARALGIAVADIAQTLQLAYSGSRFGYFTMGGRQYWVVGQVMREQRNEPLNLRVLTVRNSNGEHIQLDNVVSLREDSSPPQLYRFNRLTSATVSASLASGKTIADGIQAMQNIADRTLPESVSTDLSGDAREFVDSVSSLNFIFILALIFVFLILAAQFESYKHPLVILLTVPLALFGALVTLWYFGATLNIFSKIGMIMLIGLVTKNGILIVEFANQRRARGLSAVDAVKDAAAARLRPILMTSLSTVLGALPIALALGEGAESRASMGLVVIGGLLVGTYLTLFVIPAVYTFVVAEKEPTVLETATEMMTAEV